MANETILVIDDDASTRRLLQVVLTRAGYRVYLSADSQSASLLAAQLLPNLVIVDLIMPVVSGPRVIQQLRSRAETRNIPVIAVSASWTVSPKIHEVPADSYSAMPFHRDELLGKIKCLLSTRQLSSA